MVFPKNEKETIQLFKILQHRLGWKIIRLQVYFPDAIIENDVGERLACEFEFRSKNFSYHNHDPEKCDLIICWEDDWPESPVPVYELKDHADKEASVIGSLFSWFRKTERGLKQKYKAMKHENVRLWLENIELKAQVGQLERDLEITRKAWNHCKSNQITWQGRNKLDGIVWYSENWKDRTKMKQFLAYALSLESVRAHLNMMYCGGGIAPRSTETRKAIEGKADNPKWDYWDGWEAERF